jgi:hypothetical protein
MTEDEIIRAYCSYIVNSSVYQEDQTTAAEKAASSIIQVIENGNNLINLGSRKL